jgi:hypothetical protein
MSLVLSPPLLQPNLTIQLPVLGPTARAASVTAVLGPTLSSIDISVDNLPPNMSLGNIGVIYADASNSTQPLYVLFPDTGAEYEVQAGAALWLLAITGLKRFTISAPGLAALTPFPLQILNCFVQPTGQQPVIGNVSVNTGASIAISNPGPINGLPVSRSVAAPLNANQAVAPLNAARKFLLLQMPQASGGWVTFNGAAAAPNAADNFFMQAGEKVLMNGAYVPQGGINVYLTVAAGEVAALEG